MRSGRISTSLALRQALDDAAGRTRYRYVSRNRTLGLEAEVTFDRQAELTAKRRDLRQPDGAVFSEAHAEVAKRPKAIVVLGVDLGDEPGRAGVGCEELHHGPGIVSGIVRRGAAVGEKLGVVLLREELHRPGGEGAH